MFERAQALGLGLNPDFSVNNCDLGQVKGSLSEPPFSHLWNWDKNSPYLKGRW